MLCIPAGATAGKCYISASARGIGSSNATQWESTTAERKEKIVVKVSDLARWRPKLTILERDRRVLPVDLDKDSFPSDVLPRDETDPASHKVPRHYVFGANTCRLRVAAGPPVCASFLSFCVALL